MQANALQASLALFLLVLVLGCLAARTDAATVQFTASSAEIYNPGRGWYTEQEMEVPGGSPLALEDLVSVRDGSPLQSLVLRIYWLVGNSSLHFNQGDPLPQSFLETVSQDFATIRQAGMKALVRFAYTHTAHDSPPYGDASLETASAHLDQLSPILKNNADVIFTIQAGFIGTWGEWYYTDYYGGVGASTNPQRKSLLDKLLSSTSTSTPIAVRTPLFKYGLLDRKTTLSASEAYSGTDAARIGFHNDCFLAGNNDQGTYVDVGFEYPYLGNETKYTTMGGETCENVTRSGCSASSGGAAMTELARFHWKYLNIQYHPDVIQTWKNEGCFSDITNRLGYRLLLSPTATQGYTDAVRPGRRFDVSFVIENQGFAAPLHKVDVYLVLTSSNNSVIWAKLPHVDPRMWLPETSPFSLEYSLGVGDDVPAGSYKLGLLLADGLMASTPSDAPLPRYAIQLANTNTWNQATGINALGSVQVSAEAPDTGAYSGDLWLGTASGGGSSPAQDSGCGGPAPSQLLMALAALAVLAFLLF